MKVALILNSFPEISEKFLLNHIIGLIEAGIDVEVFAAHRPLTDKRHDLFARYGVAARTRYLDIPRGLKARALRAPALFLRLLLRNPKAAIEAIRVGKYRTVAMNLKLLFFGNAFLGKRYDVVHCHFGVNGLIGAYLKECGMCGALVTAFHGSDINSYPKRHGEDVYRTLYAKADAITSNTNFTKAKIVANGCPAGLIHIVPECLIAEEYSGIGKDVAREPRALLTVGRLEEKKGHRYALEAFARVRDRVPDAVYYVAGAGSLEVSLRETAKGLGVEDAVHFLGLCDAAEVRRLYARASVFTLPSVTASNGDMEGQGLVLQEAQICGVPVVTTRHNGIPDGLVDGETGFLVEERDVVALADRIEYLLTHDAERAEMGRKGRDFVAGKYDIGPITETLKGIYDAVQK
jgi:colanic acid/amylovoran biosynthesis glycosyltransferase